MANIKKTTLYVSGMHCPSCDVLMNDKFREESNVVDVRPDFNKQTVEVFYKGSLNRVSLNNKIKQFGYEIVEGRLIEVEPLIKRVGETFGIGVMILILYLIFKELGLIPQFNFSGNLSLMTVFIIGLVASTSTCMATSGALYLSLTNKSGSNFSKALFFNLGRVLSYGAFGFLAGLLGQVLITNLKIAPLLTLFASIFMILLGLDMTRIISIGKIIPSSLNKKIFEKLERKLMMYPRRAPFLLGAITYFLPCGFTQAVQVYALGLASPFQSSLTMMIFAIGTMPALLLIGGLSSFTKSGFYSYFIKTMGVLVLTVGIIYISNFLSLYGFSLSNESNKSNETNVKIENGVQMINMRVVTSGYIPNNFTVKKGIPVKWRIQGENVFGCQAYFIVPKLGIQKTFEPGENIIEFTPTELGTINFSCGMGMYRGKIEVI